jgi:hypothetical protein
MHHTPYISHIHRTEWLNMGHIMPPATTIPTCHHHCPPPPPPPPRAFAPQTHHTSYSYAMHTAYCILLTANPAQVIGPHGGAWLNIAFVAPGTQVIEIGYKSVASMPFPSYFFTFAALVSPRLSKKCSLPQLHAPHIVLRAISYIHCLSLCRCLHLDHCHCHLGNILLLASWSCLQGVR